MCVSKRDNNLCRFNPVSWTVNLFQVQHGSIASYVALFIILVTISLNFFLFGANDEVKGARLFVPCKS